MQPMSWPFRNPGKLILKSTLKKIDKNKSKDIRITQDLPACNHLISSDLLLLTDLTFFFLTFAPISLL